jgi:hypothetical protein
MRNLAGVILYLPPPLRPRARADAKPSLVRSETSSRSNSAKDAKMPNTKLPSGVEVLIDAPCPVSTWKPMPLVVLVWKLDGLGRNLHQLVVSHRQ